MEPGRGTRPRQHPYPNRCCCRASAGVWGVRYNGAGWDLDCEDATPGHSPKGSAHLQKPCALLLTPPSSDFVQGTLITDPTPDRRAPLRRIDRRHGATTRSPRAIISLKRHGAASALGHAAPAAAARTPRTKNQRGPQAGNVSATCAAVPHRSDKAAAASSWR